MGWNAVYFPVLQVLLKDPAGLLVLLEIILLSKIQLGLFVLMGEVGLEAGAEVDVPAPEPALQ